ncbi:DUF2852 domain-containing protein [Methylocapsa palsarum]|uniref:DUF2852 domain-containing protein n=1 Tax=Methylocapsa palsarum TaxID=1612308 RepID=A0A1I3ZB15_9HYPH|nr:DUF2852 domain-containing protein [Methylocapsa palsarum]SFK40836.1 Protein of unknown function [Methylocapsa palsarum]
MSAETGHSYQPFSSGAGRPDEWRGCRRGPGWTPAEIVAMVLGFVLFWPIGLAVIGWKIWQKNSGYQGDLVSYAQAKWDGRSGWTSAYGQGGAWRSSWWTNCRSSAMGPTGNSAFDDWRSSELARLEEERDKLVQAEREFGAYIENLRRAKDREEFDRFMAQRQSGQGTGGAA